MAGANKPDGKNPQQRVAFTRRDADRIARTVRIVEGGDKKGNALTFPPPPQKLISVFRVASHGTAAWDKGSTATVTFLTMTSTPNTATAVNLFADLASGTASRSCAIARDGTAWYLIAAECE